MASSTFCCTVSQGISANDWNTMATPGFAPFNTEPRYDTVPLDGEISPAIHRSMVDFPDPDRPSSATISPSRRVSETPSSTGSARPSGVVNVLVTPRASRITGPVLTAHTALPPGGTAAATPAG